MSSRRDYYQVLGLGRDASSDDIRKAYRKLAMQYHPDRNQGDKAAEARFKEVSEAYEVLSDDNKRRQYDQFGHDGLKSAFGPGGFDFSRDFTHFGDLQDILGSMFGESGSMFDEFLGGGRRRGARNGPQQGADLRFDLEIEFEEAVFGSSREITLPLTEACEACKGNGAEPGTKEETCRHCSGRGMVVASSGFFQVRQTCPVCGGNGRVIAHPCRACQGTGRTKTRKKLSLRIPAGVETGSRLRLPGRGEGGTHGGPAGDLYVILHVRPHDLFQRKDDDLYCEVVVPFDVAILGGEVEVPTLDGFARLKIDAGTENGRTFRLRGKGIRNVEGYGHGDLHVSVRVETPVKLNSRQKKLLKEFREAGDEGNYPLQARMRERGEEFMRRRETMTRPNEAGG